MLHGTIVTRHLALKQQQKREASTAASTRPLRRIERFQLHKAFLNKWVTSTAGGASISSKHQSWLLTAQHERPLLHLQQAAVMISVAATLLMAAPPAALATPEESFTRNCAGCHIGGGNVVQGGASLFPEDLRRNGVSDSQAIYDLIYSGKGKMPGYGQDCAPRGKCTFGPRLSDAEIKEMTDYTREQADEGWQ